MPPAKRDGISRLQRAALAKKLRDKGWYYREIAQALGISTTYCQSLINDPDGSKDAARKDRYRGTCIDCGGPTTYKARGSGPHRCMQCAKIHQRLTRRKWTRERIIAEIHRWNEIYGEPPKAEQWLRQARSEAKKTGPWPHVGIVQKEFGSWSNALEAAGFERRIGYERTDEWKRKRRKWHKENIIEAIQRWEAEHGKPPNSQDWHYAEDGHPSYTSVSKRFGSWHEAIREAGFEPYRRLPKRPLRAWPEVNGGPVVPSFEERAPGRSLLEVVEELKGGT